MDRQKLDLAVEVCMELLGDYPPCNFNGMDEYCDEWCEQNCDNENVKECWRHAIEEGWYKRDGQTET